MFSESERAALRWAESLTRVASTAAPDEDYEVLVANFNDAMPSIGLGIGFRQPPVPLPVRLANQTLGQ
ncbi:MAG: hypothetical protein WBV61_13420 [Rhodanobacteraceae bacterium]